MIAPEISPVSPLTPWQAAILGLVEGITEYLPVSSTGHLILASTFMGLTGPEHKRHIDAFNIVIQGGAILAVLGLYWPRVLQMIRGLLGRDRIGLRLAFHLLIAFIPAAVIGVLMNEWIKAKLFHAGPVLTALALGGIAMIVIGRWQRKFFHDPADASSVDVHTFVDLDHLTWRRALVIGFMQCLALWPGTSRSMVTIVGGMLVGLRPKQSAEFSFLLGLPTLGGACLYSLMKSFSASGENLVEALGVTQIVVGLAVASISAALAIKWLVRFLTRHGLAVFGWYRLALCAVIAILIAMDIVNIAP